MFKIVNWYGKKNVYFNKKKMFSLLACFIFCQIFDSSHTTFNVMIKRKRIKLMKLMCYIASATYYMYIMYFYCNMKREHWTVNISAHFHFYHYQSLLISHVYFDSFECVLHSVFFFLIFTVLKMIALFINCWFIYIWVEIWISILSRFVCCLFRQVYDW